MALVIIISSAIVKLGGVNIGSPRKGCNFTLVRCGRQEVRRRKQSAILTRVSRTFLIDTDTASDDAVALIMALRAPDVRVAAITVVAGNVDVQQGTRNALYTVELCGVSVPVYTGAEKPLIRTYEN